MNNHRSLGAAIILLIVPSSVMLSAAEQPDRDRDRLAVSWTDSEDNSGTKTKPSDLEQMALKELAAQDPDGAERLLALVDRFSHTQTPEAIKQSRECLPLLIAARRLQNKPDPLAISLAEEVDQVICGVLDPGHLNVVITNQDQRAVPFQRGGDDRSGRPARWRLEIRTADGDKLACERISFPKSRGGISLFEPLEPGEQFSIILNVARYVRLPPPGRYTLRIGYHHSVCIADMDQVDGLLVSWSEPIAFIVEPTAVKVPAAIAGELPSLIAALSESWLIPPPAAALAAYTPV